MERDKPLREADGPRIAPSDAELRRAAAAWVADAATEPHEQVAALMRLAVLSMTTHIQERLAAHGLTHAQWRTLTLFEAGKTITPSELSARLCLDTGATTRLLDRLVAKELCTRRRSTHDRRVIHLALTDPGRQALQRTAGVVKRVLYEHFCGVDEHETQLLLKVLIGMLRPGWLTEWTGSNPRPPA